MDTEQELRWIQAKQRERANLERDRIRHARQRDLRAQFEGRKPVVAHKKPTD